VTTRRATFGDFIGAAIDSLQPPIVAPEPAARRRHAAVETRHIQEVTVSLYRAMSAMMRYLDDVTGAFAEVPAGHRDLLTSWPRASIQAREAVGSAIAVVQPGAIAWEKHISHPVLAGHLPVLVHHRLLPRPRTTAAFPGRSRDLLRLPASAA